MHQRRRFSRLSFSPADMQCIASAPMAACALKVRDFSPGGLGFSVDSPLESGIIYEMRLKLGQFSLVLDGLVRWSKKDTFSDAHVGGLEFVNLTDEARSLLLINYTQLLLDEFPQ
jgi:hypothetical protein